MKRLLLILLLIPLFGEGQIITTIAGNGTPGYSGDGGPATSAKLYQPSFLCNDAVGNIFFSDYHNNAIRKISTAGIIATIAGNGTSGYSGDGGAATAAQLRGPMGIAIDGSGNIYFSEVNNHVIRKINTTGIISTIAGTGSHGYSGDGGPATNAKLYEPYGIAIDNAGNIYFPDALNYCVRKINTSGVISTIAGNGVVGFSGDGGPAIAAQFKYLGGIAVSTLGDIYISDWANHRTRKVNTSGIITTFAGTGIIGNNGDGGLATAAAFNSPNSVYLDNSGNVFIVDNFASVVRKVNPAGIVSTIAGNGTVGYSGDGGLATDAQMSDPGAITINGSGNVFISEFDNNIIRKVTYNKETVNEVNTTFPNIFLFPNPTTTSLTITSPNGITQLTITNLLGQTVYTHEYNAEKVQVDVAGLPAGVYVLKINGSEVRKFVKQ